MRKLPSTNLLVAFDAAARHLSFKRAAEELFVTPSAVGHQIRVLEEELRTQLFVRSNRSITLTRQGAEYHKQIAKALLTLRRATLDLLDNTDQTNLLIHCIPYLTNTLLVPNIKSFKSECPNVNIAIASQVERAPIQSSQLQIAIRHGASSDDGLHYEEITSIEVSPICSPDYLEKGYLDKKPTLIQLSTDQISWKKWESDWGISIDFEETIYCDGLQAVMDMAEQDLGVAMGYFPALGSQLKDDRLIRVYPEKMSRLESLYLVYSPDFADHPIVKAFVAWFKKLVSSY